MNQSPCYVMNVSPIKTSGIHKYFDMKLVSENNARRAVCFTPSRKEEFENLQLNKSPIKISDFSISTKKGSQDVIIDRLSKIDVLKDATFTPSNIDFSGLSNICDLNVIAKDEIVSVKGKIVSISGTKKVAFRDESCEKREAMIADPAGYMQVVIWGDLCEKELIEGKTYLFQKFRYRVNKYGSYINCTKSYETSIDETTDFEEPVTEASIASSLIEDCLTVLAVEKVQKKVLCCKCNEKFDMVNSTTILKCSNCGTVCKLKLCKLSFHIKLMFQKNDNRNLSLSLFSTCATDLLRKIDCNTSNNVEDIEIAIANINTMKVVYDCAQMSIVDVVTVTFD